jgi:hypothetical protein
MSPTRDIPYTAREFVNHYYTNFDRGITSRANLKSFYRPESQLTWDASQIVSVDSIMDKFENLEVGTIKRILDTVDAQQTIIHNGILIFVQGLITINEDDNQMLFAETFNLLPCSDQSESLCIYNQIFRIRYP